MKYDDISFSGRPSFRIKPVEISFVPENIGPKRHYQSSPLPLRGQTLSAPEPSAFQDITAVAGLHPFAKAVFFFPLPFFRLVCHLHTRSPISLMNYFYILNLNYNMDVLYECISLDIQSLSIEKVK